MPKKNLHAKPFDEGTITKLEIFENYSKEWIPTFVMSQHYPEVWIFDFFAGTGYDIAGVAGSPIRILKQIKGQSGNIFNTKTKIYVCFNEFEKDKFDSLQQSCSEYVNNDTELKRLVDYNFLNLSFLNEDFSALFPKKLPILKEKPSLVYLDQNGIKFLSDKYFLELAKLTKTDFLYFLASSYFNHYGNTEAFQSNIKIDIDRARKNPYKYIHKSILEQIRERLPQNSNCKLYPFTIRKSANIYGIIFGASHPRAVDKFLKTAWDKNNINGEANFDIDDDVKKSESTLFPELKLLTKIEIFQQNLTNEILNGTIKNNKDAFDYTLQQGHIATHATDVVKGLKKDGKILYNANQPLINYENAYKNNKIVEYKIVK